MPVSEMAITSQRSSSRCVCRNVLEMRAADFLLALDEHDQIHRQFALFAQRLLDAEDVREDLPLVVRRAARKDDAVLDPRLERRRLPQLQRIDRLHVVVAVDHHRAPARADAHCARSRSDAPPSDAPPRSSPIARSFSASQSAQRATSPARSGSVEMLGKRRKCEIFGDARHQFMRAHATSGRRGRGNPARAD